uniref:Uncharacterized protein n=1 Tax=Anguilla anguilla TaxID=7936 RepID=A0A0E9U5Q7_ANGAN
MLVALLSQYLTGTDDMIYDIVLIAVVYTCTEIPYPLL